MALRRTTGLPLRWRSANATSTSFEPSQSLTTIKHQLSSKRRYGSNFSIVDHSDEGSLSDGGRPPLGSAAAAVLLHDRRYDRRSFESLSAKAQSRLARRRKVASRQTIGGTIGGPESLLLPPLNIQRPASDAYCPFSPHFDTLTGAKHSTCYPNITSLIRSFTPDDQRGQDCADPRGDEFKIGCGFLRCRSTNIPARTGPVGRGDWDYRREDSFRQRCLRCRAVVGCGRRVSRIAASSHSAHAEHERRVLHGRAHYSNRDGDSSLAHSSVLQP